MQQFKTIILYMSYLRTTLILLILFFSCGKEDASDIDGIVQKIILSLSETDIKEFKSVSQDSIAENFSIIENEYNKILNDSSNALIVGSHFRDLGVEYNDEYVENYFSYLIYNKLNHRKKSHEDAMLFCKDQINNIGKQFKDKAIQFNKQQREIMLYNNRIFDIGDTISMVLPVKRTNNSYSATYCKHHPSYIDCDGFDDFLKLSGILQDKVYWTFRDSSKLDTSEITFGLKIIKKDKPRYKIFQNVYEINDTIYIHLSAYGKKIL